MMHELLKDLNKLTDFNTNAIQTLCEKYSVDVVDFQHMVSAFILLVAYDGYIAKLVYIKPQQRWYFFEVKQQKCIYNEHP